LFALQYGVVNTGHRENSKLRHLSPVYEKLTGPVFGKLESVYTDSTQLVVCVCDAGTTCELIIWN